MSLAVTGAVFGGLVNPIGVSRGVLKSSVTAAETAAYVAGQTAKVGLTMGGFYLAVNTGLMVYNQISATSTQNTGTQQPLSQSRVSQSTVPSNQTSNQYNYTPTDYINGAVGSFAQGFTFGTEYGGAFDLAGAALSASSRSPSVLVVIASPAAHVAFLSITVIHCCA